MSGKTISNDTNLMLAAHVRLIFTEDRKKLNSCGLRRVNILCYMDFYQVIPPDLQINTSEVLIISSELQAGTFEESLHNTLYTTRLVLRRY